MPVTYIKYGETKLRNNCPECFAKDGLTFSFANKQEENAFFKRATEDIKSTLYCTICENTVYPAQWTNEIERVYDYNLKLVGKPQTYFKFKPLLIATLLGVVLAGAGAAYAIYTLNN